MWKTGWKKTSWRHSRREGNAALVKWGILWRKGEKRKNGSQLSMLSLLTNHHGWWRGAIKANIQFFQFTWKEGHNILIRGRNCRLPNSVYTVSSYLEHIYIQRNSVWIIIFIICIFYNYNVLKLLQEKPIILSFCMNNAYAINIYTVPTMCREWELMLLSALSLRVLWLCLISSLLLLTGL